MQPNVAGAGVGANLALSRRRAVSAFIRRFLRAQLRAASVSLVGDQSGTAKRLTTFSAWFPPILGAAVATIGRPDLIGVLRLQPLSVRFFHPLLPVTALLPSQRWRSEPMKSDTLLGLGTDVPSNSRG